MPNAESTPAKAVIVSPSDRSMLIGIEWPIEFEGQVFDHIRVRRISAAEVDQFLREVAAQDGNSVMLPVIDCPRPVYDAMDDDDRLRVEEAAAAFLPKRLRVAAGLPVAAM